MKDTSELPSFRRPPVVEVVMGVQFTEPLRIRSLDLATFWEAFGKGNFPLYDEIPLLPPLVHPGAPRTFVFELGSTGPDMPRYWFQSEDRRSLIQLQRDRFVYNWRKMPEDPPENYPRYKQVSENFFRYFKDVKKISREESFGQTEPGMLEIFYVNIIDLPDGGIERIGDIFSGLSALRPASVTKPVSSLSFASETPVMAGDVARLSVKISSAQLRRSGKLAIHCEIGVRGGLPDTSEEKDERIRDWFSKGRDLIVTTFADLTTQKMHDVWERET